jgi:predicted RNA-binding protein
MMETYKERLQKRKENTMTNYDMDEIERQKDREKRSRGIRSIEKVRSVEIGKDDTPHTAIDIEISDDDFRRVAFQAHERDITFNKMVGLILKAELQSSEHRFEHGSKPQVLKEY